ncbi:MAG: DEAD/DEAH box helicase family protein [Spirochaetaceae bacterium]|jgi:type I restriction enzyme R subunit|nr:DEAD/DEAH box helicase family protein [Spirochaetaceae bacterium]
MSINESQTRKNIIDKKLKSAGWDISDRTQIIEEFDIRLNQPVEISEPRVKYGEHQFSDYVLLGRDGKPLAVIEAKRSSKDAGTGREQAKQYCLNIQKQYKSSLPLCLYTNGLEIFLWDIGHAPPRPVLGFPNRDDLERFKYIRENKKPLADELINTDIAGRDYQIRAIRSVMEAIEKKKRDFLLVMATGTGKTRICIALVDALMRAGHVERILFLVDRISLREQALDNFKEHLPNETRWPKLGEKLIAKDRRIYVSTYPSMLNIIRDKDQYLSPHFFDLIVIDESHRSIYNTYREVIEYFRTITLGLTATPTNIIDHNTFKLFECDDGMPTFAYTYEEAVNHIPPYLCNFQVMKIHTKFQDEGISKRTISLDDQKKLILDGKEIEEINFEGTQIEKTVINKGTNALIVKEFMEESIKDSNGVLPGKSIFFCTTMSHARRIEKIFDGLYPEYNGELAKVLVSDDSRVYGKGGLLDQFKKNDMPRIAISVDMLDTGIDVRELVNLVFAKPVYSYTKFWQMIGRGSRLLEPSDIKCWCPEKNLFLILDCWDNFEYFKLNPKGKERPPQIPLPVRYVAIRLEKIQIAIQKGKHDLANKEIQKLRDEISQLPEKSVVIEAAAKDLHSVKDDNFWLDLSKEKIEFLNLQIKPLFRTVSQVDFKDMRFRKDVLETSLAILSEKKEKIEILKDNLIEQIGELPLSINTVAKEEELIKDSQSSRYWSDISDETLDLLADTLASLMKFRDKGQEGSEQVQLNLKDIVKTKEMVEFGPEHEAVSISKYREMVEKLILDLTENNKILQKIKNGEEISKKDTESLADLLNDKHPHITEDLLRRVYKNRKGKFIQFIRHILGLEILENFPDSVSNAFEKFIQEHSSLNTKQLEFLNLLKDLLIERESIKRRDLIESPFTIIHPQGIRGLFAPSEINEILILTEKLAG